MDVKRDLIHHHTGRTRKSKRQVRTGKEKTLGEYLRIKITV
jgi:hypothetical protein